MGAKRSRSAAERWRSLIAAQERSGAGVAEFARRRGLNAATLYWWRSRLGREARGSVEIVPVDLVGRVHAQEGTPGFEVVLPGGRIVRVPAGFDERELVRLMAALERAC